ncbi:MAG: TlpA family protein disulfide reductase [Spirochaetales bacterium]|nr:TlpA family protein disulfide reductase [Spirochaetales bacterium]
MNKKLLILTAAVLALVGAGLYIFISKTADDPDDTGISALPGPRTELSEETIIPVQDSYTRLQTMLGQMGFQLPTTAFPAPDFTVKDIHGNDIRLSDYKGRPVLFNLWATWCPPCREEMPSMDALYTEFKKDGLVILAASSSLTNDTFDKVKAYALDNGFTFPILFDDTEAIDYSYFTGSIPTSYLIDKQGMIAARLVGAIDWSSNDMKAAIREMLK